MNCLSLSSANNSYAYFPLAIELMAKGKVKADPIITHQFMLTDALEAFQIAENKDESGAIKVIINP